MVSIKPCNQLHHHQPSSNSFAFVHSQHIYFFSLLDDFTAKPSSLSPALLLLLLLSLTQSQLSSLQPRCLSTPCLPSSRTCTPCPNLLLNNNSSSNRLPDSTLPTEPAVPSAAPLFLTRTGPRFPILLSAAASRTALPSATTVRYNSSSSSLSFNLLTLPLLYRQEAQAPP